jgi:hypothetical protein
MANAVLFCMEQGINPRRQAFFNVEAIEMATQNSKQPKKSDESSSVVKPFRDERECDIQCNGRRERSVPYVASKTRIAIYQDPTDVEGQQGASCLRGSHNHE